jgi:hypothetical protein
VASGLDCCDSGEAVVFWRILVLSDHCVVENSLISRIRKHE